MSAGADAIMIYSRKKDPAEIFTFAERFREKDATTPLVVVPTSFNEVTEEESKQRGANIVIYANRLKNEPVWGDDHIEQCLCYLASLFTALRNKNFSH